jgi:hypothetical protein
MRIEPEVVPMPSLNQPSPELENKDEKGKSDKGK